jgi:phosphoenolpyruvate carboxykinase (diphosphate)
VFHVADYGLPVPADKTPVPLIAYARLLKRAFDPPEDLNTLPYSANWQTKVCTITSLLLRPLVVPAVHGISSEKRLEIRFFVPGGCCANLDFVESIFGNAGDPNLPECDAGLDPEHWTGTTGCVILAPHLRSCRKKDLGLPHVSDATDLQKSKGICWTADDELYNGGKPFKITLRDERGIMVTILADNYFGESELILSDPSDLSCTFSQPYQPIFLSCSKKKDTARRKQKLKLACQVRRSVRAFMADHSSRRVADSLSFRNLANVFGLAEEEHAGGALAFKAVSLGDHFAANPRYMQILVPPKEVKNSYSFDDAMKLLGDKVVLHPEGYATDKLYPEIHMLPEDFDITLQNQTATFTNSTTGKLEKIRVLPNHTYVHPSGYKVRVDRHPAAPKWRLIGTLAEPCFCHKPSTVSGGGKSEISKSLNDAVIHGPIFIGDYEEDMSLVDSIVNRDYSNCLLPEFKPYRSDQSRPIMSTSRTLGSVIKLLTPDEIYTEEHNEFVSKIPNHIRAIVFAIKSNYNESMGTDWMKEFTVDITNGVPGHELSTFQRFANTFSERYHLPHSSLPNFFAISMHRIQGSAVGWILPSSRFLERWNLA